MGTLFDRFDVEPIQGKYISANNPFPEIYISEKDEIFCYPKLIMGRHSQVKESSVFDSTISIDSPKFYRIIDGCILLDKYINTDFYGTHLYKKIDCGIRFPMPDNYYAVFVNGEEDKYLTREIFGLTHEEITVLLKAYAKVMDFDHEYSSYPRLTKSPRTVNYCDATDLWIPEKFPYVAFDDSGYFFSHISLWGFYRHIQLLTLNKIDSTFSKTLLNHGVSEEIMNHVFEIGTRIFYQTKVTKNIFDY